MLLTEYNEAEAMELFREEGTLETLVALVRKGLLTVRQAAEQASSARRSSGHAPVSRTPRNQRKL